MLFYSVECGLKGFILKKIGKNTYDDLKSYYEATGKRTPGHDLKAMTKVHKNILKYLYTIVYWYSVNVNFEVGHILIYHLVDNREFHINT